MKVRKGFVSNSSSSSFIAFGVSIETCPEEIAQLIESFNGDFKWDKVTYFTDDDTIYIGREFDTIKDDETGLQFKTSTKEKILAFSNMLIASVDNSAEKLLERINKECEDEIDIDIAKDILKEFSKISKGNFKCSSIDVITQG